jgi:hypothetical protein
MAATINRKIDKKLGADPPRLDSFHVHYLGPMPRPRANFLSAIRATHDYFGYLHSALCTVIKEIIIYSSALFEYCLVIGFHCSNAS